MTIGRRIMPILTLVVTLISNSSLLAGVLPDDLEVPVQVKENDLRFYSEILECMGEPALWKQAEDVNAVSYRFTYIRSKDEPIILRLDKTKAGYVLSIKQGDSRRLSKLKVDKKEDLTNEQLDDFVKLFDALDFWGQPAVGAVEIERDLLDGSAWILEAAEDGRYHFIRRLSPGDVPWPPPKDARWYQRYREKEGWPCCIDKAASDGLNRKFVALGQFLLGLSDLKLTRIY
jgi:hypothetical protein